VRPLKRGYTRWQKGYSWESTLWLGRYNREKGRSRRWKKYMDYKIRGMRVNPTRTWGEPTGGGTCSCNSVCDVVGGIGLRMW